MSPLLIAFLGVLLVPLFVASWRLTLFGLAGQGLIMASIAYQQTTTTTVDTWIAMFDLVVVRGIGAPLALYTVLLRQRTTSRHDVIPPNLMSWTLAVVSVLLAFRFSDMLVPDGPEQSTVAVATAALLLGLLVLATQTGPFSQIVGLLRIENAIALFELGVSEEDDLVLRIGQLVLLVVTVVMCRWYLQTLPKPALAKASVAEGLDT